MTGKMLDERLGKIHFWTLFVGFHTTFLVQHWLGVEGMPRRYADYLACDGFTTLNTISTIGAFLLGLSTLPFLWNVYRTAKRAPKVEADDPWGYGRSLEWATPCPPPRHNFVSMPRIRSEAPATAAASAPGWWRSTASLPSPVGEWSTCPPDVGLRRSERSRGHGRRPRILSWILAISWS
jgi:heme/copper-type cytochrome/quinol oxidase subunit 1